MLVKVENYELCWWCGEVSNSREHKVKRTDVSRIYGRGPFDDEKLGIFRIGADNLARLKVIQSPDSDYLKFEKCICQKCNNQRSMPFDKAYDIFMNYIDNNLNCLKEVYFIDFKVIFGNNFVEKKTSLFRYYTKHICCRLAVNGYSIPPNIIKFLNGRQSLKDINFIFQIKNYKLNFSEQPNDSLQQLYIGELNFHKQISTQEVVAATGWYTYKQFSMNYVVAKNVLLRHYIVPKWVFLKARLKLERISYAHFLEAVDIKNKTSLETLVELERFPYVNDLTGEVRLNELIKYKM